MKMKHRAMSDGLISAVRPVKLLAGGLSNNYRAMHDVQLHQRAQAWKRLHPHGKSYSARHQLTRQARKQHQ
jgi:hypothetical protein